MGLNQRADIRADDVQGSGGRPGPRHGRAALLRLATWFEEAGPDRADDLATAAYGLHPALHLEGRTDEGVAATTSWWQADPDRSTVTEHPGTRLPEPVRDYRAQQARLRDAAESSAHWRRAGASQIRALLTEPTPRRARLDLSGAGMEVLMELLTAALGSGDASRSPASAGDLEFSLRLHVSAAPGSEVTIRGEGGELTLEGLRLRVTSYDQHTVEEDELSAPLAPGAWTPSYSGSLLMGTAFPDTAFPARAVPDPDPLAPAHGSPGTPAEPAGAAETVAAGPEPDPRPPVEPGSPDDAEAHPSGETPAADAHRTGPDTVGDPSGTSTEGPGTTGNLPGPDPDVETTGAIDLSRTRPWG
ncbi:DUF2397 family protein [Nocardiopsis sp. NPDC058631]|uniref:DUF2397 family protein n=1 Tax=Nocardiopsis sp. NPDC058631 TaxID=3346566 RepID=UPI0036581A89